MIRSQILPHTTNTAHLAIAFFYWTVVSGAMCGWLCSRSKKKKDSKKKMVTKKHKHRQIANDGDQESEPYGPPAQAAVKVKHAPPPPSMSSQPPIESTERLSYRIPTTEQDAVVGDLADSDDGAVDVPEAQMQEKAGAGCVEVPSLHVPSPPHMNETYEHVAPTQPPVDAQPMIMSAVLLRSTLPPLEITPKIDSDLSMRRRAHRLRLLREQLQPDEDTLYEIAPVMPDVDLQ
jgi:hypothetical protein